MEADPSEVARRRHESVRGKPDHMSRHLLLCRHRRRQIPLQSRLVGESVLPDRQTGAAAAVRLAIITPRGRQGEGTPLPERVRDFLLPKLFLPPACELPSCAPGAISPGCISFGTRYQRHNVNNLMLSFGQMHCLPVQKAWQTRRKSIQVSRVRSCNLNATCRPSAINSTQLLPFLPSLPPVLLLLTSWMGISCRPRNLVSLLS